MKAVLGLLIAIALTGCGGNTVKTAKAPDGSEILSTKCKSDPNDCYTTASTSCGGGSYQVIDSESHAGGVFADILPGPVTWYGLTYKCGKSDGKLASFPFRGAAHDVMMKSSPTVETNCTSYGNTVNCTSR